MNALKITAIILLIATAPGCESNSVVREYEVDREQERVLTSDLLRDQFEAVPFVWKVPSDWTIAENDQFSAFAWTSTAAGATARITVSDLPTAAGIEPQFMRWRGQLQLPESDPADVMNSVETLLLKGLSCQWIEINGETETILGMIAPYKDKLWIFKFRSANSTAKEKRQAFREFCESLSVE